MFSSILSASSRSILCLCVFGGYYVYTQESLRLYLGSDTAGVAQVFHNGTWKTLCGWNFRDNEARVFCRQLGRFTDGKALPLAAYGELTTVVPYPDAIRQCLTGDESSLFDCDFDTDTACEPSHEVYASANCFNQSVEPDTTIRLEHDGPYPGEYGYLFEYNFVKVGVFRNGMWGHICSQFWDDVDATVACRELGFKGGVASFSPAVIDKPFLISEINCKGTEGSLADCPVQTQYCYSNIVADVLCFNDEAPRLYLVGGRYNFGKVIVSLDGINGTLCDKDWTHTTSDVVCQQLGFHSGYLLQGENFASAPGLPVWLESVSCGVADGSLWRCQYSGYDNVGKDCSDGDHDVSLYCFSTVQLVSGVLETDEVYMGRVEIYTGSTWAAVCASTFTAAAANIACAQFGYPVATIMAPDSFGQRYTGESVDSLKCTGQEVSLVNCSWTESRCQNHSEHAALLCLASHDVDTREQISVSGDYHGTVFVTRFNGVRGTVCRRGWDDDDATVVCRMQGYLGGVVLGTNKQVYGRYEPVWMSDVACTGTESSLSQCQSDMSGGQDWHCSGDLVPAGVLCYPSSSPAVGVRLGGRGSSAETGRVEVLYNGTWGTVCTNGWTIYDAIVVCRRLGFADGLNQLKQYDSGNSDEFEMVLSFVQCDGTEDSLLQCASSGWRNVGQSCRQSSYAAGVYCFKHVKFYPSTSYGAVLLYTDTGYSTVCSDNLSPAALYVACQEQNPAFQYSVAVCCSAFGPLESQYKTEVTNLQCNGSESSLLDCSYDVGSPDACASGTYAGVVCSDHHYAGTSSFRVDYNGVLRLQHRGHQGVVCTEGVTVEDATVACRQHGLSLGYPYKASAYSESLSIRWLRGFGCDGTESEVSTCGGLNWGEVGICSWDAVAAVICSNTPEENDFLLRLANRSSTAGRVEVKINGQWGTICGNDMTRNEAAAICNHLGYNGGVAMEPDAYGPGSGPIHLTRLQCHGNETDIRDCVWSGYKQTSPSCDHSVDAAVRCFANIRLTGSTSNDYGRLEWYDSEQREWLAVCDRFFIVPLPRLVCKQLGYVDGRAQSGSALGPSPTPVGIFLVECNSTDCTFKTGECERGTYVSLYCSHTTIITEDVSIRLALSSSFYGPLEIRRYGLWGAICGKDFNERDAHVVCRELNYNSGYPLYTYREEGFPVIQGPLQCTGQENSVADCVQRLQFSRDPGCFESNVVAGVMCYGDEGLTYSLAAGTERGGRLEIYVHNQVLLVSTEEFDTVDASVFCRTVGFAGGDSYSVGSGTYAASKIDCQGDEVNFLRCVGDWDPRKSSRAPVVGVTCYHAVSIELGDGTSHGVLYATKGLQNGPVCASGFTTTDAEVACRNLRFQQGLPLCCTPYGYVSHPPVMTDVSCAGTEVLFTDCPHTDISTDETGVCGVGAVNYAAIVCYNGALPVDYSVRLPLVGAYTGEVILTYLGVDGRICTDDWDDFDAIVVCREIGYQRGIAYNHFRVDILLPETGAPYWTSAVKCKGSESRLGDCPFRAFGTVSQCETGHHAGVVCFDDEGVFYRLSGGELRYGRVEVAINGEWRAICNLYWENPEAHVLCKTLGFRSGDAYFGAYTDRARGPVWNAQFQCRGQENSLNHCPFSGWTVSTSPDCALHERDAGVFCYTSVKLSTGVGRQTDRGGVLLYYNNQWNTVCSSDFNDTSARAVCRELGFVDGQAQCCSAYGAITGVNHLMSRKIRCAGEEEDVTACLVNETCDTQQYASVICYGFLLTTTAGPTPPPEKLAADWLPVVIGVIAALVIIAIAVLVIYCVLKSRRRKQPVVEERFDNTILSETMDGSFVATNQLHGVVGTPQTQRVEYANRNGAETVNVGQAYPNPAYSTDRPRSDIAGSSRTVISVGSNPYDSIRDTNHDYESLRERRSPEDRKVYDNMYLEPSNSAAKPRATDDEHQEPDGNFFYMNSLSEQPEVSSPKTDSEPPSWSGNQVQASNDSG